MQGLAQGGGQGQGQERVQELEQGRGHGQGQGQGQGQGGQGRGHGHGHGSLRGTLTQAPLHGRKQGPSALDGRRTDRQRLKLLMKDTI